MLKVFIKASERTGNPEVWAYEEIPGGCDIVFGSLVSGGLNKQSKDAGYGRSAESKKRRSGYRYVADFTVEDIHKAKEAVRQYRSQGKITLGTDAFLDATYEIMFKIGNKVNTSPPEPVRTVPLKPVVLEHQSADNAYSW